MACGHEKHCRRFSACDLQCSLGWDNVQRQWLEHRCPGFYGTEVVSMVNVPTSGRTFIGLCSKSCSIKTGFSRADSCLILRCGTTKKLTRSQVSQENPGSRSRCSERRPPVLLLLVSAVSPNCRKGTWSARTPINMSVGVRLTSRLRGRRLATDSFFAR